MAWYNPIDDLKSAYNWAAGNPAGQKAAYGKAAGSYSDLGNTTSGQYGNLGNQGVGYYTGANYGNATFTPNAGWKGGIGNVGGAFTATKTQNPNAPLAPDQALTNMVDNPSTQLQGYYDYMGGQVGKQTNQEQLYGERKNGNDPAAAYQDTRATQALDNAAAARGGYNSGAALRSTSDYYANANAQRSQQLASLAGGADTSRATVNSAYGNAAAGASGEKSSYYSGVDRASMNLAAAKAGISSDLGSKAIQAYQSGQVASIEAYLAQSGVDAKGIQAFVQSITALGGAAGKAASAGGGGGAAGAAG